MPIPYSKVDSKNITCAILPVNNYLRFWGWMARERDILAITIDAQRIAGKFKELLHVEEDC
jgi:hypothetical protein